MSSALVREAIKAVVPELPDACAEELVKDTEFRLRMLVEESLKFMYHSRRHVLTTDDVNSALRAMDMEPLYGYGASAPPLVKRKNAPNSGQFEDEEVDLAALVAAPLPKVAPPVSYAAHWLAIEGVQPAIPQNPPMFGENRPMLNRTDKNLTVVNAQGKPTTAAVGAGSGVAPPSSTTPLVAGTFPAVRSLHEIKHLVEHTLSKELQIYYERLVDAITGVNDNARQAALISLAADPGLHQLVPYLSQFIADKILQNLNNLPMLMNIMLMTKALVSNPELHLEPYIHQLMPAVLTCVLGKRLCQRHTENHWALRVLAAQVVSIICRRYSSSHNQLQPRTAKTLLKVFLDPHKPLTSHFGAVVGLEHLGAETISALILPNFASYVALLALKRDPSIPENVLTVREEAERVHGALLSAVGNLLKHRGVSSTPSGLFDPLTELAPDVEKYYAVVHNYFGSALLPYCPPQPLASGATPAVPAIGMKDVSVPAPPVAMDDSAAVADLPQEPAAAPIEQDGIGAGDAATAGVELAPPPAQSDAAQAMQL
ncbi:transcription initiation factor TFIID complex 60 kDa subunit [Capsaspora owczarzaki ATCC 30864]|uniref:Transcription initiation factor TFIID complex 60 kDa subunit n=1 Tax=Capsaspora owczarzaki (strain ATCC 30864) TaxID=595528 RepID=A0A0D2X2K4_CAPO3|nr:transcription initiation factor TFIID complex 60 kDa subunit [Capsaspora owczarzaki ATCC 30864]KJE92714.1 transcription initiation factor TFIID complex 60 kDa subunit [Capsaspora owczarzaki ATCC 30864]|eukprot:XP_004363357.1 transcription initiation factor TFIID complex 60 kDa subunit [Capsaspora owczarzaki ATCC 30864]